MFYQGFCQIRLGGKEFSEVFAYILMNGETVNFPMGWC